MSQAFNRVLHQCVSVARWAPSSHNCQPWKLVNFKKNNPIQSKLIKRQLLDNEYLILIAIDKERKLSALPSLDLEMYLSCGMFIGVLREAFLLQGFVCQIHWLCDKNPSVELLKIEEVENCIGLLLFTLCASTELNRVEFSKLRINMIERRTHRAKFKRGGLDLNVLQELLKSRWSSDLSSENLKIYIESNHLTIKSVAKLVAQFASLDFSNFRAWRETYRYIHFNTNKSAEDGFYLESLMGTMSYFKLLMMKLILTPIIMQILRIVNLPKIMALSLAELVSDSSQIIYCSIPEQKINSVNLIQAGARVMEIWLNAQSKNIALHPLSVMLQHELARKELKKLSNINGRIVFFSRLGFIKEIYQTSPRRQVKGIISDF